MKARSAVLERKEQKQFHLLDRPIFLRSVRKTWDYISILLCAAKYSTVGFLEKGIPIYCTRQILWY